MAMRTFTTAGVDNLASNALNWDVAPGDGDGITIPLGQTCEWDLDISAWTGLAASVITGELKATLTPGTYVLKMAGNITGTGILRAGTVGSAYPITCKFSILLNGNYKLNLTGDGSYQLYDTEPTNKVILLSAPEAAGQTALSVDTDVTGDIWAAGDIVRVDNINPAGSDSEERIIADGGIAATEITITVGLTNAKLAGARVILISRNIKVVGNGSGTTTTGIDTPTGGVLRCEIRACTTCISQGSGTAIAGTVSAFSTGLSGGSGIASYRHDVSGIISGGSTGLRYGYNYKMSGLVSGCAYSIQDAVGLLLAGIIGGGTNGLRYCLDAVVTGSIGSCGTGAVQCIGLTILGGAWVGNAIDLYRCHNVKAYNVGFGGATEFSGYNSEEMPEWAYAESFDHDQVANAFKAWTRGGITVGQSGVTPAGWPNAHQLAPESATYRCFVQRQIMAQPGQWTYVDGWLRKDRAMTWLPRLQLILPTSDPIVDSTKSAQVERIMTDSTDTWENFALAYFNSGLVSVPIFVRAVAKNASGAVYTAWRITRGQDFL